MLCICTILYFNTSEWIFLDLWSCTYVLFVITINVIKWCSHIFSYLCLSLHCVHINLIHFPVHRSYVSTWPLYHCNSTIYRNYYIIYISTFLSHNHYKWVIKLCKISAALPFYAMSTSLCVSFLVCYHYMQYQLLHLFYTTVTLSAIELCIIYFTLPLYII